MPLFVPVLRLLMLFLNVYDSYKTLKDPPPSSRSAGRPSVRAVSQRKRDMKGCLAVWIVWASLSIYERTLESIVCLFIPFYDEFKSLALLFLILTRARGAEPIYLHLIRPLIKPYTHTADATLELMLMTGDFIFALSTYPIRLGLEWYRNRFGRYEKPNSAGSETGTDASNGVVAPKFSTSTGVEPSAADVENLEKMSKKPSQEKVPVGPPSRRPSDDVTAFQSSKHSATANNLEPNFFKSPSGRQDEGSSRHQIWYPPKSSYVDEVDPEFDLTIKPRQSDREAHLAHERQQDEEWRQYPAFPSAYPPTPLAVTSRLVSPANVLSSSCYPPIEEVQQDFRQSLLPPREPLNPSHAGDLSDEYNLSGIASSAEVDDADDCMSDDDYEEEDEFNITLRTPLLPLGSLRSHIQPRQIAPLSSALSAASIPSRSSALTTADTGPSSEIDSLSDSSLSPPNRNAISPSVLGKKRSYPRTKSSPVKNRVRQIESSISKGVIGSDNNPKFVRHNDKPSSTSSSNRPKSANDDSVAPSSSNSGPREDQAPEEKRRKIVRSVPTTRVVNASRIVRPRVARHVSPLSPSHKTKLTELPGAPNKRNPVRLRSGPDVRKLKENDNLLPLSASSSTSASVSDHPHPRFVPPKPSKQNMTRKRL